MGKTKAEIIAEYRELKKENLKLNNQLEHWKQIARKENDRVVDLAKKLDESEKEKSLIRSQRDNLLLEHEKMATEFGHIQDDLEILQAEVRKIQYDEVVTHDQGYVEGYKDAEYEYKQALDNREKEIDDMSDACHLYYWIIKQLHENATK